MFSFNDFPETQSMQSIAGGTPFVSTVSGNLVENFFKEQDKFFESLVVAPAQKSPLNTTSNTTKANNIGMVVAGGIAAYFLLKVIK
mgnify:CR=1 FL=1|jgi:hypothetical protein